MLAGNPNCGKSTLFNRLTSGHAHVGNWAGVTVVCKTAPLRGGGGMVADLPGVYALRAFTREEEVTREYLQSHKGRVLNLIDGRLLERSLCLTAQLLAMGCEVVVAVGMLPDGVPFDCALLSSRLGVPVVRLTGHGDAELEELCELLRASRLPDPRKGSMHMYLREGGGMIPTPALARVIKPVHTLVERTDALHAHAGFWAGALLEGGLLPSGYTPDRRTTQAVERAATDFRVETGRELRQELAAARYRLAERMARGIMRVPHPSDGYAPDRLLLSHTLALPLLLLVLAGIFWFCFGPIGRYLEGCARILLAAFAAFAGDALVRAGVSGLPASLLCEGVIGGVGGVLAFLPQLALLFGCLTLLEESGYLARVAFLADRPMRLFGLTGRSLIPMLMGFGCTVPALLACRTLREPSEQRRTAAMTGYLCCGAKLPVCALLAGSLFPGHEGLAATAYYTIGLLAAFVKGLGRREEHPPHLLLELPAYRLPTLRGMWSGIAGRCGDFLRKAGTVILLLSILLWMLRHLDGRLCFTEDAASSLFTVLGSWMVPLLGPLGFGCPETAVALLAGFMGKEAVVATLVTGAGAAGLSTLFTPLSACSFLVFCALYSPCISALGAAARELGVDFAVRMAVWQTVSAYLAAMLVYQVGILGMHMGILV